MGPESTLPTHDPTTATAVQMMTILVSVSHQAGFALTGDLAVRAFVYLAAALTAASGVHYLLVVTDRYAHRG